MKFKKYPKRQRLVLEHKISGHSFVFTCVHNPRNEEFAFSDVNNPYGRLISANDMERRFNIIHENQEIYIKQLSKGTYYER